ncbi:hypothetical protein [Yersinia alsatica]|uniref:hypothetical protein n=1 Tax=Yersinia alsatica TaxID=2890317 RepID=UPI0011A5FAFA|nr:hypothetical protein [Yersinia alsatica]
MKKVAAILIIACSIVLAGCDQKPQAPFGFKWGQSVEDVKKLSLPDFKVDGEANTVQIVSTDGAPSKVYDAERFLLVFMPHLGLTNIKMYSKSVDENSFYFNNGRSLYLKLSSMLEEKYGIPKKITEKADKDGDDFYFCLQDESCGVWSREYEKDNVKVTLKVNPVPGQLMGSMGKAWITIEYEYLTDEMVNKIKEINKKSVKNEEAESKKNNY